MKITVKFQETNKQTGEGKFVLSGTLEDGYIICHVVPFRIGRQGTTPRFPQGRNAKDTMQFYSDKLALDALKYKQRKARSDTLKSDMLAFCS